MKNDERWKTLAQGQLGLITRAQAREAGLSPSAIRNRLRSRTLIRVLPGVYRLFGAPVNHAQSMQAAVLYAGRRAAISGPAAAAIHGFPRLAADEVEISSPRNLRSAKGIGVKKTTLLSSDVVRRGGLPVTSELRTLLDLAATATVEDLRSLVDHLLRTRKFSAEGLARELGKRRSNGVEKLRSILSGYRESGPTESELEARMRDVFEEWGLPQPVLQYKAVAGGKVRRADFAWAEHRIYLEVDGHRWHSDPLAFERDRRKHNELTAQGWRLLRVTWLALMDDPEPLYWQLCSLIGEGASAAA